MTMTKPDDTASSAPGVRAATHVPRTWRHYLSLRPEVVALVALVASVAVIGAISHRTIFFQIYEVAEIHAHMQCVCERVRASVPACACVRLRAHVSVPTSVRMWVRDVLVCLAACMLCARAPPPWHARARLLQAGSGLAAHPCIFEYKSKIGGDIQDWRAFLKSPLFLGFIS
jgi:hypothetical protein